jgi:hypothetical protein
MLAEYSVLLEELTKEQEDFPRATESRRLAGINPKVAPAPHAAGTKGPQVC